MKKQVLILVVALLRVNVSLDAMMPQKPLTPKKGGVVRVTSETDRRSTAVVVDPYPLHTAARNGDIDALYALRGIGVNALDDFNQTPLHVAVDNNQINFVKEILGFFGTNMNLRDTFGRTPLHLAAYNGFFEIVQLLLASMGINENFQNKWGQTPLHNAVDTNKTTIVKAFLAACDEDGNPYVDVNIQDRNGCTPLHLAVVHGCKEMVQLLLEFPEIDVKIEDKSCRSATEQALYLEHNEIADLIEAKKVK